MFVGVLYTYSSMRKKLETGIEIAMSEKPGDHEPHIPSENELRLIMAQAMEQMFNQSRESALLLANLNARLEGAIAGTSAVAQVVDENAAALNVKLQTEATKDVLSHIYEKSHQYVTVIIGGAFAAYFTTLGTLAARFKDTELRLSAVLMTFSLTIFVMWEVFNVFYIGRQTLKEGLPTQAPKWMTKVWYFVLCLTVGSALPAIGLSLFAFLRGLIR